MRALEVLDATGQPLSSWQELRGTPVLDVEDTVRLVLVPDRAELHRRCAARFQAMLGEGGLEEARRFASLGLAPDLPAMRAIGLRPVLRHVAGEIDREEAIRQGIAETRRYAKRQSTWLRRHMISWKQVDEQQMKINRRVILPFIDPEH